MFKYIEQMRKVAFRIMSKTYGTRMKNTTTTGATTATVDRSDAYPLSNLVDLLCFEDVEEAKNACQHYNLTVEETTTTTTMEDSMTTDANKEAIEMIFWKASEFKYPKCLKKGTILPLRPRKMIRTIEMKLNGVTRLGICRGQVSGVGATLEKPVQLRRSSSVQRQRDEDLAKAALMNRIKEQQIRKEKKKKEAEEKQLRLKLLQEQEAKKQREQRERKEDAMRKVQEEKRRQEAEQRRRQEAERKAAEARALRILEEKKRVEKEKEDKRRKAIMERNRILKEKEERELQRQHQIKLLHEQKEKARKEEEERRRLIIEEGIRKKELKRLHLLELQKKREKEEEEQKRKAEEEEERRLELKWQAKMNFASKLFVIKKWKEKLFGKSYKRESTRKSLESFNPIRGNLSFSVPSLDMQLRSNGKSKACLIRKDDDALFESVNVDDPIGYSYEDLFYRLGTDTSRAIDLSKILLSSLQHREDTLEFHSNNSLVSTHDRNIFLFKLAIIINTEKDVTNNNISKMVQMWIDSRLKFNRVERDGDVSKMEVRTVVVCQYKDSEFDSFDAILFVIPPTKSTDTDFQVEKFILPSRITHRVPFLILRLDERPQLMTHFGHVDGNEQCSNNHGMQRSKEEEFDECLESGCEALVEDFVNNICQDICISTLKIEKISLRTLCCKVMRRALWDVCEDREPSTPHLQREAWNRSEEKIIEHCHDALNVMLQEIKVVNESIEEGHLSCWPGKEFIDSLTNEVPTYFPGNKGLPRNWKKHLDPIRLQVKVSEMFPSLGQTIPAIAALDDLLNGAPLHIRQRCGELFRSKQTKRCFDSVFQWQELMGKKGGVMLYLPCGDATRLIEGTISCQEMRSINVEDTCNPIIQREIDQSLHRDYKAEEVLVKSIALQQDHSTATSQIFKENERRGKPSKRPITSNLDDNYSTTGEVNFHLKRQKNSFDTWRSPSGLIMNKLS